MTLGSFVRLSSPISMSKRKIRADIKRRIDVDELEPAGGFDLAAQRSVLERGEHELVVAPDQLVGPAARLTACRVSKANRSATWPEVSARGSSICSID